MRTITRCRSCGPHSERTYQKIRSDLALAARRWQRRSELSPGELARRIAQSSGLPTDSDREGAASLDLLVRSLLALGATQRDIALELVRNT